MEDTKQHGNWLKNSGLSIKLLVALGLFIVVANLAFVFYASNYLLKDGKGGSQQGASGMNAPGKDAKPLSELKYEKVFMNQYENWTVLTDRLLYLAKNNGKRGDDWRQQMAVHITQMKIIINHARQIIPPKEHKVAHLSYEKALGEFEWVAENLPKSISNKDEDLFNKCLKRVEKGRSYLNDTIEKLMQGI